MKAMMKAATVAVALLALASPAMAVDFVGYFRDGTAVSLKGGPASTYQVGDYKLRLGNENDWYGEWGLEQTIYKDKAGVEAKVGFMFAYYGGASTAGGAGDGNSPSKTNPSFGVQQNYVTMKFPQWAGMKLWGGKMYYLRENVDMIDFFYLNTGSTPGVGATDIDIGMGKLAFSIFGVGAADMADNTVAFVRPDLRWYGLPVWSGGTLTFDLNYYVISRHKDLDSPSDELGGVWATAEWAQSGILGGWNNLVVQYANGANASMGTTPGVAHKDAMQFRVIDALVLQPSASFQVTVGGSYQQKQSAAKVKTTAFGVFARPVFWVTDYFKLQGDIGYTASKVKDGPNANLIKWTFAPTISPAVGEGGGMFVRPELRLYVTGGSWNDDANITWDRGTSTDKSSILMGAQVETWF